MKKVASRGKAKKATYAEVKCPDCGRKYRAGAPHQMFCSAKTCDLCGTTYGHSLPIHDRQRVCDDCLADLPEDES